jgi:hypothetical protein
MSFFPLVAIYYVFLYNKPGFITNRASLFFSISTENYSLDNLRVCSNKHYRILICVNLLQKSCLLLTDEEVSTSSA